MYRLFLSQSLVSLCELRSTTDFPYTAELDSAFGAAVGGMGPRWVYHMCVVCCFVVVVYRWPGPVYLPAVVWLLSFMVCCCLHTGESNCKFYVFGCCVVVIVYRMAWWKQLLLYCCSLHNHNDLALSSLSLSTVLTAIPLQLDTERYPVYMYRIYTCINIYQTWPHPCPTL